MYSYALILLFDSFMVLALTLLVLVPILNNQITMCLSCRVVAMDWTHLAGQSGLIRMEQLQLMTMTISRM